MVFQILVSIFFAMIIFKGFVALKKNQISFTTYIIWSLAWLLILFFVWQPGLTNMIAGLLRVGRGADAVLYLFVVIAAYLFYRQYLTMERLNQQITGLSREMAILEHDVRILKKEISSLRQE